MSTRRCPALTLLMGLVILGPTAPQVPSKAPGPIDVQPRPLERIAAGTVIGEGAPKGWTHLVHFIKPRIGSGDVDAVPKMAVKFASMFMLATLANVTAERGG